MKILIATDGSEYSAAAIETACEIIFKTENCEIEIISAYEVITYTGMESFGVSVEYVAEVQKIAQNQATKYVNDSQTLIRGRFPDLSVQINTKILNGSPGRVIVEEAKDWGADIVIVGSHGYGFWERAFLGSVSQAVVNHAPCSVLIVRKKGK